MLSFNPQQYQHDKPLLILDIDETLLYASAEPLRLPVCSSQSTARSALHLMQNPLQYLSTPTAPHTETDPQAINETGGNVPVWDHYFEGLWIYKRPFVDDFLQQCSRFYQLAVWTSARANYAQEVVRRVLPDISPLFVFSEQHCVSDFSGNRPAVTGLKPLSLLLPALQRVGSSLARVLVLDDSAYKHSHHLAHLIPIAPWFAAPGDRELQRLLPYLQHIAPDSNIALQPHHNWSQHPCVTATTTEVMA